MLAMIAALALVLVCVAPPTQASFDASRIDDARARKAWGLLTRDEQEDALARFEAEAPYVDCFQNVLVRCARALEERDLGFLPAAAEIQFYDPALHAPGQPIPRHWLAADSSAATQQRERMLGKIPPRKLRSAWSYDWATGEVVRVGALDDPERRFENALAGFAPQADLAAALVERALDGGARRRELAAFAHAYTDREGRAFPGLTLYDAWSSGADMEMPDVDVLGIVHDLLGEWRKWTAPVPPSQHDKLYDKVGELFQSASRYRELRTAIAWTFLEGKPALRGAYPTCIDRFHGLWEANASTPSEVAKLLPDAEGWSAFLARCDDALTRKPELRAAALRRRATLESDQRTLRAHFLAILAEQGAFERTSRPTPKAPDAPVK